MKFLDLIETLKSDLLLLINLFSIFIIKYFSREFFIFKL